MTEVVIIGAGLIGLMSAWELVQGGVTVTILERQNVGQASSWAGGGILSPLYPWRYPAPVNHLTYWGQMVYHDLLIQWQQLSSIDGQWQPDGLLMLEVPDAIFAKRWAATQGITIEVIETKKIEQSGLVVASDQVHLLMPQVAHVRNPRLLKALKMSLLQHDNVTLYEQTAVTDVTVVDGSISGVVTATDRIACGGVVVASGAWTGQFLQNLAPQIAIQPVLGQMLLYQAKPGLLKHIVLKDGHYMIPRQDGRVLVGSTVEHVGFNQRTTRVAREQLRQFVDSILPPLNRYPIEQHWAGLRPGSIDGIPTISEHPHIKGLYINAGHYRNGVVMAPSSCRLLADLVLKRTPLIDPHPYRLRPAAETLSE